MNDGIKIYYCSASGGNKLSDLPITQAGVYIIRANTYYKSLDFMGTNGCDYHYDYTNNAWTSLNSKITNALISYSTESDTPATELPSAFNKGITLQSTGSSTSYPLGYGMVVTVKMSDSRGFQINTSGHNGMKLRTIVNEAWESTWADINA